MRHMVLVAAGKQDERGNIFKPYREKARNIPETLGKIINECTTFVFDGGAAAENTLKCILNGAGIPEEKSLKFEEFDKLSPANPEGPTSTELFESQRFLMGLDAANVVVCTELGYLRAFAEYILERELKYEIVEADALVINFGQDGQRPDSSELVSPYMG